MKITLPYVAAAAFFHSLPTDPGMPCQGDHPGCECAQWVGDHFLAWDDDCPVYPLPDGMCRVEIPSDSYRRRLVLLTLAILPREGLSPGDWLSLAYAADQMVAQTDRRYSFQFLERAGANFALNRRLIGPAQMRAIEAAGEMVGAWPESPSVDPFDYGTYIPISLD